MQRTGSLASVMYRVSDTRPRILAVLSLVAVLLLTGTIAYAAPTTPAIEAAKQQATQAREKLDGLQVDLEVATEDYYEAEAMVTKTSSELMETERELSLAQDELNSAQDQLSDRAVAVYRTGALNVFEVFIGATDFQDLITRLDLMRRLNQQDAQLLQEIRLIKTRVEHTKLQLEDKKSAEVQARNKARDTKTMVERLLGEQKAYIASIDSKITELIAQERKRLEEIAKREAEAARQRALQESNGSGGAVSGARTFDESSLGAPHPAVVKKARSYVGKTWYQWGGTTPAGFDCSGLSQYCYRSIGINIPRTSRQQYRIGSYIPPNRSDLLAAGDLLFFGYGKDAGRIHHVAIYVGNGRMIHAPQTGMKVSETSLWSRSDYVGAVRP